MCLWIILALLRIRQIIFSSLYNIINTYNNNEYELKLLELGLINNMMKL